MRRRHNALVVVAVKVAMAIGEEAVLMIVDNWSQS